MEWLEQVFYGNSLFDWGIALAISLGLSVVLYRVQRLLVQHLIRLALKTETGLDDFIASERANVVYHALGCTLRCCRYHNATL